MRFILAFVLAIILSIPSLVFAVEQSITIDTTGWTQHRKNMRQGIIYAMIHDLTGCDPFDTPGAKKFRIEGDTIYIEGCSVDLAPIITQQAVLARYDEHDVANENSRNAAIARKNVVRQKLKTGRGFTDAEIDEWFPRFSN